MKEKLYRFMVGRNGPDQLTRALTGLSLAVLVFNLFLRSTALNVLWMAIMIWAYYRMFSRNLARRREENARYMQWEYKLVSGLRGWWDRLRQRRDYVFFRCPECRAMLRVPRGKGKIRVTCRKCGNAFERRT
ncbi:MAG: hypothetical protein IJ617_05365 [Oscillospiraceae bacterium]|nr:hypothetical protein [Oscillospiraceae bacterium]